MYLQVNELVDGWEDLPVSFWAIVPAANQPSAGLCGPVNNGPAPAITRAGLFPAACPLLPFEPFAGPRVTATLCHWPRKP